MNFNEFVNEVKDNIKLFLPRDYENAEVSTMECHKLNRAYTGLMVRKEGEMLTPTINLNRLYEAYKAQPGVTMETVCRKIADIVIEAPIQVDLKAILNYEDVKDNKIKLLLFHCLFREKIWTALCSHWNPVWKNFLQVTAIRNFLKPWQSFTIIPLTTQC